MDRLRPNARSVVLAGFVLAVTGCHTCDLVEAELRYTTRQLEKARMDLENQSAKVTALESTIASMAAEKERPGSQPPPEAIHFEKSLARIELAMLTGGRDVDQDGIDDGLIVVIAPHDYDNDVFKCPGSAAVELFETMPNGAKSSIGQWEVSATELRPTWRQTLVSQGYQLYLPWQMPPSSAKLRAIARFTTPDGRFFEAEKDVRISRTPASREPAPPSRSLDTPHDTIPAVPEVSVKADGSTKAALLVHPSLRLSVGSQVSEIPADARPESPGGFGIGRPVPVNFATQPHAN